MPDTRYELSARNENGSPDIFAADSFCVLGPSSMDSSSSCGKEPVERKAWRRKGTSSGLSEKQLQELQDVDPKKARRIISNRAVRFHHAVPVDLGGTEGVGTGA